MIQDKRYYVPQFTFAFYTNSNNTDYQDKPTKPVPNTHRFYSRKDMFDEAAKMNLGSLFGQTNTHSKSFKFQ